MKTVQSRVKKALRFWSELPEEKQQELLAKCRQGWVIQCDSRTKTWSVVSIFFGMDLAMESPFLYLFPEDIEGKDSERTVQNSSEASLSARS